MPETTEKQDAKPDPKAVEAERKAKADAEVKAKEQAKRDEEQAKQDEADVETFLAFHRGEAVVRRANFGALDLTALLEQRKAEKDAEESDED